MDETLKKVTQSISSLIESTQTTIRTDFSKVEKITFNNSYMESVFLNLISNSIKYSQPDISPEISIYTEKQDGIIRLIIEDNGQGLKWNKQKGRFLG